MMANTLTFQDSTMIRSAGFASSSIRFVVLTGCVCALLAGDTVASGQGLSRLLQQVPPASPQQPQQPPQAQQHPSGCPDSLPALYTQVSPAVVSITAISINPYDTDNRITRVMGSGVIIDASGLILSNSHVVFGRQVINVTLDDGTALPAKLVGADPVFDIALLKVPTPTEGTLPTAKLGNSGELMVGEEVFAIGNPLGLEQTLTHGIVSAINQTLPGAAWSLTEPLIQTDAAINPGNSGGPLVDACGRIVGITTAILPEAQNIGFAVPANLIKEVIPQLVEKGRVVRPWFGVQGQFVMPVLKELLRVPLVDGFLVEAVEPGSPAEQKGLQGGLFEITIQGQPILLGGDIITEVNGVAIDDPRKLAQMLGGLKVGSPLKVTVMRESKSRTISLTLGERPVLVWDVPERRTAGTPGTTSAPVRGRTAAMGRTIIF
jgi:serine protease Do